MWNDDVLCAKVRMCVCCACMCMHAVCIHKPCPKFLFLTLKPNTDITQGPTLDVKLFISGL